MVEKKNTKTYVVKSGKVSYSKRDRVEYFNTDFKTHLKVSQKVVPNIDNFITVSGDKIVYSKDLLTKLEGLKKQAKGDSRKVISHLLTSLKNILGLNVDRDKTASYEVFKL